MPKAIVDPRELRNFAAVLEETIGHLRGSKSQVSHSFNDLHAHWQDKKYSEFDRLFTETMGRLEVFLNSSELYSNYLRKKAEKAERYLGGGY
ncbi:MAG: WXG-repeat protein [Acidobacteria bacterium]|nr:WXG-repeat protein [Acidobacteriota bacterium]